MMLLAMPESSPQEATELPLVRGHHKVFLGMAAGVGKTYRMLQEAHAEAEAGRDVVIGYLEPHRRPETAAQAAGLETVPRRRVVHRDVGLDEMDLPAIFAATYAAAGKAHGPLDSLNVMNLGTPASAIISAIVFNALVIPLLVPLALRGVQYRPAGATVLLRRNLLIYGLGGLIAPFVGIKLLDLIIHNLLGA